MVLVSDGEDLEGQVEDATARAKEAGVVVHTVGVGTEAGQPVPDLDREGRRTGFKRDEAGQAVVSRLNMESLEAIARGTGGKAFRLTPADTSLGGLAAAIEGMEQKTLAREFSYRRKERFQVPLAVGLVALGMALILPLSGSRRAALGAKAAALVLLLGAAGPASAQTREPSGTGKLLDELLLRPRRSTEAGLREYSHGNHPQALTAFEGAASARPQDPHTRFNLADGLYKNGKFDEAATLFKALGEDAKSPLAGPARFNLGNSLYQKQDFKGAIQSYRDALRVQPDDVDTRRNLELALRALREQEEQQKRQSQDQKQGQEADPKKNQSGQDQKPEQKPGENPGQKQPRPPSAEEKADQRFRQETGMPRERAMQLLEALQQNEKSEQKKLLAAQRAKKKGAKDW